MKAKLKKTDKIRLIAVIIFIVVSVAVTIFIIPIIKYLQTPEGREILQIKIDKLGIFAPLIFIIVQIIQIIIALIPGEPIEIMGGFFFGTGEGLILCLIGVFLGTVIIYYMVKSVGKPLVDAFVSEEKRNKLKFLQDERKLEVIIFLLFLIPGTPKDTLTYFVPLTDIRPMNFFLLSTVARIPSIVSSTLVGTNLGKGNLTMSIIIFAITIVIGIVGIFVNNKIQDSKEKP